MGCCFFLQGIFPTQGLNRRLPHWQADSLQLSHRESPIYFTYMNIKTKLESHLWAWWAAFLTESRKHTPGWLRNGIWLSVSFIGLSHRNDILGESLGMLRADLTSSWDVAATSSQTYLVSLLLYQPECLSQCNWWALCPHPQTLGVHGRPSEDSLTSWNQVEILYVGDRNIYSKGKFIVFLWRNTAFGFFPEVWHQRES